MLNKAKVSIIALAFAFGFSGSAALAQPIITGGLINVAIGNLNVTVPVQAAVNIAANVCGVQLNVLSLAPNEPYETICTSEAWSGEQALFTLIQN
jgi:hypothetical protein